MNLSLSVTLILINKELNITQKRTLLHGSVRMLYGAFLYHLVATMLQPIEIQKELTLR